MTKVFLSYRRGDSADVTGRIDDRLVDAFGRDGVFKDIDSIPLGMDFRKYLTEAVGGCDVVLVVMGESWLGAEDESGSRRLDDDADFVRIEVETALQRSIPVVPVLLGNARMPKPGELPPPIRELSFRNATKVRPDPDFNPDMTRIVDAIKKANPKQSPSQGKQSRPAAEPRQMSGISVTCQCGKSLLAPEKLAGKRAKCPVCGAQVEIPVATHPAPPSLAAPVAAARQPTQSMQETPSSTPESGRDQQPPPVKVSPRTNQWKAAVAIISVLIVVALAGVFLMSSFVPPSGTKLTSSSPSENEQVDPVVEVEPPGTDKADEQGGPQGELKPPSGNKADEQGDPIVEVKPPGTDKADETGDPQGELKPPSGDKADAPGDAVDEVHLPPPPIDQVKTRGGDSEEAPVTGVQRIFIVQVLNKSAEIVRVTARLPNGNTVRGINPMHLESGQSKGYEIAAGSIVRLEGQMTIEQTITSNETVTYSGATVPDVRPIPANSIVGTWQEIHSDTGRRLMMDIAPDMSFLQTEVGRPDSSGRMSINGDRLSIMGNNGTTETFGIHFEGTRRLNFSDGNGQPMDFYWQRQ